MAVPGIIFGNRQPLKTMAMKKLLANLTNCIIVCLLLSSCSSNISIAKRHYRGGYYVEHAAKTTKPVASEVAKTNPVKRVSVTSISSQQTVHTITEIPTETNVLPSNTIIAIPENVQQKKSTYVTENLVKLPAVTETPVLQKETTTSQGIAGGDRGERRAALSLLWIIIIIILILWLIGL